jgi:glycosyltransferase involved in cell wall biosynthesis
MTTSRPVVVGHSFTVALLAGGDRFEDFFDKIGVSLDVFRDELTGGWLFNYVTALRLAGVRTILIFTSARVAKTVSFTHKDSQATVYVLPSPLFHRKLRHTQRRFFPASAALAVSASYLATPLRGLSRLLRDQHCDAILCQEYESARFDTCVLLGRLLGLPVFATYQGANETKTAFERFLRPACLRRSAGLIIPSREEVDRVRTTYRFPVERIRSIPNPVDVEICPPATRLATRRELGIGDATRVVAWHGRIQIPRKGLDVLLDAWDRLCAARSGADTRLLLVGSGRDDRALRERLGSRRDVVWIDRYVFDRSQVWSYLSAADVYAIPSRHEGFAVAVQEAMACGLPVVGSDAPGVADIFPRGEDDGGIIVPRGSAEALASALARVLDDRELAERLRTAGIEKARRDFSLEVVGRQLRAFLFSEATSPPRASAL